MNYLKWLLIVLLNLSLAVNGYSQNKLLPQKSIISPKTVVLRHESQTDTLTIPVVSNEYPELQKVLSYKAIFDGDDLADVEKKYESCSCGITGLNYDITFENKGIISIILYFYRSGVENIPQFLNLNISTGKVYDIADEINPDGLKWIVNTYKTTLRKRISLYKQQNADADNSDNNIDDEYKMLTNDLDSLDTGELLKKYLFTKNGLMFSTEKVLPQEMHADEPDRALIIPFNKLKIYKTAGAIVLK
jgi:hypothetical protein